MAPKGKKCSNNDCEKLGVHACSGCKVEMYCSRECQIGHWVNHKAVCKGKKAPTNDEVTSFDSLSPKQLKHVIRSKASDMENDAERKAIISTMTSLVEKQELIDLASKHVKLSEVTSILSTFGKSNRGMSTAEAAAAANAVLDGHAPPGASRGRSSRGGQRTEQVDISKASPKQLRDQANLFRKNPDFVRKQQPSLAHMSNAELSDAADHLEQMASDPSMMKEAMDQMSKLSPEEKEQIQNMTPEQKEQLKNLTPEQKEQMKKLGSLNSSQRKQMQIFQEGLTGTIDEKWIAAVINLLKTNSSVFKTIAKSMFAGATDDQIDPYVDFIANLDEWKMRMLLVSLQYVQAASRPIMSAYGVVDTYTYGNAKHIATALAMIVCYILVRCLMVIFTYVFSWGKLLVGIIMSRLNSSSSSSSSSSGMFNDAGATGASSADAEFNSFPNANTDGDEF